MQKIACLALLVALLAIASAQDAVYVNILTPQKQPGGVVSSAQGVAITVYTAATKTLSYYIMHTVASPTVAHIHLSSTGGVAHLLSTATSPIQGTVTLTDAQASVLSQSGLYYNIHSTAYGAGEIRSDISNEGYNYYARLDFAATGSTTGSSSAKGIAIAKYVAPSSLTVSVVHNAVNSTAGHIHKAEECKSGGLEFDFALAGHTANFTKTFVLTADQVTLLQNKMYYVNIHTAAYPGGEIRGQLFSVGTTLAAAKDCQATSPASSIVFSSLKVMTLLLVALASVLILAF